VWIVTGASGFVGKHVLSALKPDARGLYRNELPAWDVDSLRRVLSSAEGVVHCASVVHKPATPPAEYERFNIEGTRALVEAARAEGLRRFVFMSSIKVYGETPSGTIDERTPTAAEAHYARTKLAAERVVLDATDLQPVVLRLCPVYGRGDKGNVRTMIRAIQKRRFFVPGDGSTRKSIVHVSTVADVVRAATRSSATGVFVVSDRNTPSIRELSDAIARNLGRRRPVSIPAGVLRGAASFVGHAVRRIGITSPISGNLIDKAMTSSICDPGKAERTFGLTCSVDRDAALRDEISWLREIRAI
jgi:nucleoside-diphosphate-sugar epimerase